jgi:hypothetical protein
MMALYFLVNTLLIGFAILMTITFAFIIYGIISFVWDDMKIRRQR